MSISEQVKELRTIANNMSIGHNMPISLAIERFREAADTIESLSAKLQAENCGGGWIPCSTGKMPHRGSTVLVQLKKSTDGITGDDDITFDISYLRTDKNEWVSSCGTYPLEDVIAWREIKPYHEP